MKNFKIWLKNNKKLVILTTLVFVFSIAYILISSQKKEVPPEPIQFKFLSVDPPAGEQEKAFPTTAIAFNFSEPVDMEKIEITINPNIDHEISSENNDSTIYIIPRPRWQFDTQYAIILEVKAKSGQKLPDKIKYSFKFKTPTFSPLTE